MSDARAAADKSQRQAADPLASVFVTANAGSGKTKVLIDRIARLLLEGSTPSSFLCITYTKAAAAEMQRRLFERLGSWCIASDEALARDLSALAGESVRRPEPEALARARALFASALETPGGLKIQTIHAFCERLLARFPIEAGIAPGFDIADDARAEAMLARARASCALSGDEGIARAFARFAERMGVDALDALLDRIAHARLRPGAADPESIRRRHGASGDVGALANNVRAKAPWARLRDARDLLQASSANDQKIAHRLSKALEAREAEPRAMLEDFIAAAFKGDGELYKINVTKALDANHPWIASLLHDLADLALAARDQLNAIDCAEDAAALVTLGAEIARVYERAKAHSGVLDFEDLIEHAQTLLSRADAAPWVLYKLDGGLDHILIDEGQDTSPAQWALIAPLQDEFFSGLGARERMRTVFAVGDPKQSIYAFQGADPERFLGEARDLSRRAHIADQKFVAPMLETSFRSAPEVLQAVDWTFESRALTPGAREADNIVRHLASRARETGLVEIWPLTPRPERASSEPWDAPLDVEADSSAAAVLARALARKARGWIEAGEGVWEKGALRPMHAGDILVLVRKRGALFRELAKAFKREGLPVAGADRMVLRDELAAEDCLALMRVALDSNDDLSLACVLKGPWCDLTDDDADLFPLAFGRDKRPLIEALRASGDPRYAPVKAFIEDLIARRHNTPFDLLSWALETAHRDGPSGWMRVFQRLGAEARDPIEELLARALKPPAYKPATLQGFVSDLDRDADQVKREMEAIGAQVRIMTVHGSKGLEAPVVLLPDTTAAANDKADEGVLIDASGPYLLRGKTSDDAATRAMREAHAERAMGEHWRLLYVAMTRARDRLIVCGAQHGTSKTGESADSWRLAVEDALRPHAQTCDTPSGVGLRIGEAMQAEALSAAARAQVTLPVWANTPIHASRMLASAAPSRAKALDPVFSPRGEGQKRFTRGRMIHGLLQRLPDIAPHTRAEAARLWLTRQGVEAKDVQAWAREALAVIDDPRFAPVFSEHSRAEAPIVGMAAGRPVRGIVDRLAVAGDEVLILDFKTDRPAPKAAADAPAAYVLQMALYREVVASIFPGKSVRCALLWTEAPHLTALEDAQLTEQISAFRRG